MDDRTQSRYLRIHLSTALVMMIAAGMLIQILKWVYERESFLYGSIGPCFYSLLVLCLMVVYYAGRVSEHLIRTAKFRATTKTPTLKRQFWQLHLSTAMLMMFAAGGFTWKNTKATQSYIAANTSSPSAPEVTSVYGFPFNYARIWLQWWHEDGSYFADWRYSNLAIDVGIAIIALIAVAFVSESLIRRLESKP